MPATDNSRTVLHNFEYHMDQELGVLQNNRINSFKNIGFSGIYGKGYHNIGNAHLKCHD